MAWWKRKPVTRCELCSTKLPAGSVIAGFEQVYVADGETKLIELICDACWQRHLPFAAEADARFRRENPFEEVCARLRDGDAEVRGTAARQLARLGDERAVAALCDAFAREEWRFPVAGEILDALAALGGPEVESTLIAELNDVSAWHRPSSGDQPMRSHADYIARALLKMGGAPLLLRVLFDTMASTTLQPAIRAGAASYLSHIAYNSAVGYSMTGWGDGKMTAVDRDSMVEPLMRALRDESARVREHAARALGHLGDKRALRSLLELLGDENRSVRYRAAQALGDLRDKRAAPALRQALKDDREIGAAVREALAQLR
ncbi:HEAT repeat domain-containing protein [Actinomadura rudentiformis]|nr:HEAT repeat domain-containing protein [Actinomadura rudentiformis]